MSSVELTVLMPVYNGSSFLKESIESVLNQSFRNFEFLIINDGSTDNSEAIIKSYTDQRINYVKNEVNEGLISSLNKGLLLAKGNLIARMDADDICLPSRLEKQVELFRSDPGLIVAGSDYYEFDDRTITLIRNESDSDYQKAVLLFATSFAHPTVMMKNIFSSRNLVYDINFVHTEDYKLWTDLSFLGKFGNVNSPLLKYRRHSAQVTALHRQAQLEKSSAIRRNYCERLGFNLNESQYSILNEIGNNVFVTKESLLLEMHVLLSFLINENKRLKTFNQDSFLKCMHRYWYDICGHTNLGVSAFMIYTSSAIARSVSVTFSLKMKLLAKCFVRRFRSR